LGGDEKEYVHKPKHGTGVPPKKERGRYEVILIRRINALSKVNGTKALHRRKKGKKTN